MGNEKKTLIKRIAVMLSFSVTAEIIALAVISGKLGIKKKVSPAVRKLVEHTPDKIRDSETAAPAKLAANVFFGSGEKD